MGSKFSEFDSVRIFLDSDLAAADGRPVERGQEGSVVWISPDGEDTLVEIWRKNEELVGGLEFTVVSCKASELRKVGP